MHNRNIKLTIMYDGSIYSGWQRLGNTSSEESIQGILEYHISINMGETVKLIGSGRTDQGVHAYAMVANYHTHSMKTLEEIKKELNLCLPEDIRILKVEESENKFHSRYSCLSKTYVYRIDNNEVPSVFTRKYTYHHKNKLDIDKMRIAANYLVGMHDFSALSSTMKDNRSTIKEIYWIEIEKNSNLSPFYRKEEIVITINGNGFLYNMVRIIVGTLIEVGEGKLNPDSVKYILDNKDRSLAGPTAQFQGLFLKEVKY